MLINGKRKFIAWCKKKYYGLGWGGRKKKERFNLSENLWDYRIKKMIEYVDFNDVESIMDLGAGGQHVRKYLPKNVKYIPVDYVQREHCMETVICDFNNDEFPQYHVDLIYLSGILEYIEKPEEWIRKVCDCCEYVVLAYNTFNTESINERESRGWISHLNKDEIIMYFSVNGFKCVACDKYSEYIEVFFKFEKQD